MKSNEACHMSWMIGARAALVGLLFVAHAWTIAAEQPIEVHVAKAGATVVIDVTARVQADPEYAWAVLTDYDHMASYVSTLKSSRVVSRNGDHLEVAQTGEAKRAFLHFSFSTVRAVDLIPSSEIRSRLVSGDFKSYEFTTRITSESQGALKIVHHGEYVPNTWVPPVIGPAMIETETHKQYADLIDEILRRQAAGKRTIDDDGSKPEKRSAPK